MKKLLIIPLLALTGCFQLMRFADGEAYYNYPRSKYQYGHPYKATRYVASEWFMAPARANRWWGFDTTDPIGTAWLTILWPVGVVDLVGETSFDTVMCVPDWILADPAPTKGTEDGQ